MSSSTNKTEHSAASPLVQVVADCLMVSRRNSEWGRFERNPSLYSSDNVSFDVLGSISAQNPTKRYNRVLT
jgi:uncharacterized protein YjbJ (UPF0337 family)